MNGGKKRDSFILQAGILAAAGFISRIIGLLYVSPVTRIIGHVGLGYYQSAYNYYAIVLMISSYSIPSAISKVIAQKLSLREYRNAHRVFICAMYYVLGVGLVASLLLFFGAGHLVPESAAPVLQVLAPTIFVYGVLGVLRGYFQAHKSMVQTSVSQILEQIVNAAVSIGAAYGFIVWFMGTYEKSSEAAEQTRRAVYGAMGSALGTGAGVLAALLFMAAVYALNRPMIQRRIERDHTRHVDSYREISVMILQVVLPFIMSTAVYNLSSSLNNKLYTDIMIKFRHAAEDLVVGDYGLFNGEAMKISNIPIAFSSAMAAAIIPTVSQLVARKELADARDKMAQAVKTIMLISIPSAVGLFVLAKPVTWLLFPDEATIELAAKILMALAVSVIFYALSTLSNSILQGVGRVNTPIVNAAIALLIQTAVMVPLLFFTDLGIYGVVIATILYSGLMCVLNQLSLRKALGYRQEIMNTFIVPFIASAFMGAIAWVIYESLLILTGSIVVSVLPAIAVGAVVYFALVILFKGVTEEELRAMPKGHLLVRAARKCGLLR
ncbi:lipid II flippase MurJ [Lachnospiraceae bacterium]|nr:polysaccharide biosynthesis protein [Acetatifactor sp.]GFH96083.1 lipid II flippase MurJ [Lachnospiraceae bacterium]